MREYIFYGIVYTENIAEAEIECEGEGRGRATLAVGSWMEDEEKAAAATEETRRKARRRREGLGIYNATIAGCDRSCELRAGNLGTVYANLREEDAGKGE